MLNGLLGFNQLCKSAISFKLVKDLEQFFNRCQKHNWIHDKYSCACPNLTRSAYIAKTRSFQLALVRALSAPVVASGRLKQVASEPNRSVKLVASAIALTPLLAPGIGWNE